MLSKSKIKLITSLSQKKFRDETGLFIAEGTKLVCDLATTFRCSLLIATSEWFKNHTIKSLETLEIEEDEFKKISNQKSPQGVLAVFEKPQYSFEIQELNQQLSLALDDVQDPGNLGTIIRIADWFGVRDIFCSEFSVDAFSPKTVQATMGALARVRIHTVNLVDFLRNCPSGLPVYGTEMNGENIYEQPLSPNGIIVMGNEGNGISSEIQNLISNRLLFPNFPLGEATSESLNVAVATALICGEFRRRS
jgi:TrmH family RNA methyltransferase